MGAKIKRGDSVTDGLSLLPPSGRPERGKSGAGENLAGVQNPGRTLPTNYHKRTRKKKKQGNFSRKKNQNKTIKDPLLEVHPSDEQAQQLRPLVVSFGLSSGPDLGAGVGRRDGPLGVHRWAAEPPHLQVHRRGSPGERRQLRGQPQVEVDRLMRLDVLRQLISLRGHPRSRCREAGTVTVVGGRLRWEILPHVRGARDLGGLVDASAVEELGDRAERAATQDVLHSSLADVPVAGPQEPDRTVHRVHCSPTRFKQQ